jgi:hypothetical protein
MSALKREQLLEMFDPKQGVKFAQNQWTKVHRYFDPALADVPLIEKVYEGAFSSLQERECDMLFHAANKRVLNQEVTSRVAGMFRFEKKQSALAGRNIYLKWYGFDLDDWGKLLHDGKNNPMHEAQWLLEVAWGTLKALQLVHEAGMVHCDIHPANLCLPHQAMQISADGKFLQCMVNPNDIKLIDLGLSLKALHERGLPPRVATDSGALGPVIQFNPAMQPPPPPWLLAAFKEAQSGNNAPFLALDWRVDVWRLGQMLSLWEREAPGGNLRGTRAMVRALQELAHDLCQCVPGSDHDRLVDKHGGLILPTLPHQRFIDQIEDAIDEPKARELHVSIGNPAPAWVQAQLAQPAPRPAPAPPAPPQPTPAPHAKTSAAKVASVVVGFFGLGVAALLISGSGKLNWLWATGKAEPQEPARAVDTRGQSAAGGATDATARPTPNAAQAAVDSAKSPPALTPGQRFEAYAGGPVLVVLPKVESKTPGSQLGSDDYPDEKPRYEARVKYNWAMGEAEITFAQWNLCVKDGTCEKGDGHNNWGEGERPAINISWNDIQGLDKQGKP